LIAIKQLATEVQDTRDIHHTQKRPQCYP
jgi:hypothetical protein